ncbi:sigma-70 family RNA polymerase sigma factor [Paenibacillus mesophilus]|uniref:RNA polymerase sigma factor SigJ n=1 Tax=Paenibacillus mesophilus TaxID=2582849 RepID=UPI00110DC54D|nr:RNA polymerase sigma factor SigJ [Paenibacillus mesophilus]TMV49941.1 sigma-70 family RNA polymerase sigma factor [Paenibacillus mesophilus]
MVEQQKNDMLLSLFEAERPRLLRVAYSITSSVAEAEDCVQETWMRLQSIGDAELIRNIPGWLTTTVARLALDTLNSARSRWERYVGHWLPEPLVEDVNLDDPAERVALDDSVSIALMIVLQHLSAVERTAFLLHDVFGLSFVEISTIVGRSPAAVRKLASRARKHIEQGRPRFVPTFAEQKELVLAFAAACQKGDMEKLVSTLDPNVVWRGDGGGDTAGVARVEQGAERVANGVVAFTRQSRLRIRFALVNGAPGLVLFDDEDQLSVVSFTVANRHITTIHVIRDPDKLSKVRTIFLDKGKRVEE